MHSAPPVSFPVGRSRFLGLAMAIVGLVGVAVTIFGWRRGQLTGSYIITACAVGFLSGLMACRFWMTAPKGELRWDGQRWSGPGASIASDGVRVHLDWQHHLLVRLRGVDPAGQWLWLSKSSQPARWNDLRRAVYSRAMTDALRDAANP